MAKYVYTYIIFKNKYFNKMQHFFKCEIVNFEKLIFFLSYYERGAIKN